MLYWCIRVVSEKLTKGGQQRGTRNETRDTRHETRDTRHETRDTRHETRDTRHETRQCHDAANVGPLGKAARPGLLACSHPSVAEDHQTTVLGSLNSGTRHAFVERPRPAGWVQLRFDFIAKDVLIERSWGVLRVHPHRCDIDNVALAGQTGRTGQFV
jgi:hypothetical protein